MKICLKSSDQNPDPRFILNDLPHLTHLTWHSDAIFRISTDLFNGDLWEWIIRSSLPVLDYLEFCCKFSWTYEQLIKNRSESFATPFYLVEKRWFFQCVYSEKRSRIGLMHTLPFRGSQLTSDLLWNPRMISALPCHGSKDPYPSLCQRVTDFEFNTIYHPGFLRLPLSNIKRLTLLSLNQIAAVSFCPEITHLTIHGDATRLPTNFVKLWKCMPKLHTLSVRREPLMAIIRASKSRTTAEELFSNIRSLTIEEGFGPSFFQYIDPKDLRTLRQILATHCEHLSIYARENPRDIFSLLQPMKQLKSLYVHSSMELYVDKLEHPTSCTSLKSRLMDFDATDFFTSKGCGIFIWFGSRMKTIDERHPVQMRSEINT